MKKMLIIVVIYGLTLFAQTSVEKVSTRLQQKINSVDVNEKVLVWIFFKDKGNNTSLYYALPENVVSKKSLLRREKVNPKNQLINFNDLPVNEYYIDEVTSRGVELKQKSKWFNGISGYLSKSNINKLEVLSFVSKIDLVETFSKRKNDIEFTVSETDLNKVMQPEGAFSLNYGNSFTQLNQINVPAVHNLGYNGTGITICVMDAGFSNLTHEAFNSMNIIAKWDFVDNDPDVSGHSHGTGTLSTIGGFKEGQLIGPAYGSSYLLARTEDDPGSETPLEEDNWIAALEWADSIGVDVTSTSLGYLTFDPPYTSYTWQDMDGNTARITIAADIAVGLGITVVNSAGNNGYHQTHNTLNAPADGDSVITIGAVSSLGNISSFSSVGPTVDGRIKPDLMAMGSGVYAASTGGSSNYGYVSGTSFSCPLAAGVAALILCVNPDLTPMQVRDAMRTTASRHLNPDNQYGWGIIDALSAISVFPTPVELTSFTALFNGGKVYLEWVTSSESNNLGFEIQRENEQKSFSSIGFLDGMGTSSNYSYYNFIDQDFSSGKNYYRLKQIDLDGTFKFSDEVMIEIPLINKFSLSQNYPNPFNPSTNLNFTLPNKSNVTIKLFDILGNEIRVLFEDEAESGIHHLNFDMRGYPSGIYFVKLIAGEFAHSIKITLIK